MMIQPTQLCGYVVPAGLFIATEAQIISNRPNAQKLTSTRSLSMSLGLAAAKRFAKTSNPADSFMQNKPNFRKAKMNIALYSETNYERKGLYGCRKNKAKQTQNEPNLSRRSLWRSRIKPNFKGKKMLLRLTINGRRRDSVYNLIDCVAASYPLADFHSNGVPCFGLFDGYIVNLH